MTSDRPNPNTPGDDPIDRSLDEFRQVADELDRRSQEREDRWQQQLREDAEKLAAQKAIVADKSLNIDDARYQKAIEVAQVFADEKYRGIVVWSVVVRRNVTCIAADNEWEWSRAAGLVRNVIEIRGESCHFTVEEAEAIALAMFLPNPAINIFIQKPQENENEP